MSNLRRGDGSPREAANHVAQQALARPPSGCWRACHGSLSCPTAIANCKCDAMAMDLKMPAARVAYAPARRVLGGPVSGTCRARARGRPPFCPAWGEAGGMGEAFLAVSGARG